ncbi:MAG TPA: YCF48-related protein, partial [Thermoanaerobaculia bacterium]|nr:YCF48-related protein [Thermoanaerobaculia bacterium]
MRSHRKQHFFVAILICIAGSSAMAGVNRWTNSGPEGAVVNALIAAPGNDSKLFALTWNGIFESTNGGGHWTRIDSTPSGVVRLAIRPDTGSLYAVASGSSLFRSDDGGEQWTELTSPVSAPLRNIAFSPDGRVMYAISPPSLFSSTDDGRSWTASDITDPALASLAVLPDGTVLAGGGGLHVSTDGGRTFTLTAITPTQRPFVSAIAGDSQNIYLGTPLGVMKSSDKAVTWTLLPPYPVHGSVCGCRVNEIAMTSDGFVAATDGGVFSYSSDGWKQIGTAFDDVDVSSVIVTASSIVAGSSAGVSVIGPNDGDWTSANAGLLGAETFDVTFDPTSSSSLYSASNSGIFVREGTNPWKLLHAIPQANAVAVAQQDPHAIFAASVAGVEKSPDNGKSWKLVTPSGLATRLAISPADPSTIYASLVSGLMKSTDGGETFKTVSGLPFDYYGFYSPGLAVDPLSASNAFVGTDYGIYRTQLGGTSWLRVTTRYADAFAIDPANPSVIYAGTVNAQEWDATQLGGLLKSIDGGLTWN